MAAAFIHMDLERNGSEKAPGDSPSFFVHVCIFNVMCEVRWTSTRMYRQCACGGSEDGTGCLLDLAPPQFGDFG